MSNIPKMVVNNTKSDQQKKLDIYAIRCELYGQRNALVNIQTDTWIKIEEVNKKIQVLEPIKKNKKGSNVY
jgi:hypothetical protein|tara:strand:- start:592 stop:804 length:213 start_codon:yes stop_codon:yes gene_type:complete